VQRRRSPIWVLLVALGVVLVASGMAISPTVTLTRPASLDGPVETVVDDDNLVRQRQTVVVGGEDRTDVVVSVLRAGEHRTVALWIERPQPALYGLEARFLTSGPAGPDPSDVWLEPPAGAWPASRFDARDGDVRYAVDGLGPDGRGSTSTTVLDFHLPERVADAEPGSVTVEVTVRLQPARSIVVRSWEATSVFELPLR
jgi:hypothetical protein